MSEIASNQDLDFTVLSEREQEVLLKWLETKAPPLAISTSVSLFQLFLNGQTAEMIQKLNPQFTLGSILHARVRDRWDQQRSEAVGTMFATVRDRVVKSQVDMIEAVTLMLSATSKQQSEKYLRYIQTGNEAELEGAITIKNLSDMKRAIESLQLLTGQRTSDNPSAVTVNVKSSESQPIIVNQVSNEKSTLPTRMDGTAANVLIRKRLLESKNG